MARHVALLRGINLGAVRRVAMDDLRAGLATAGYGDVRTLGQSGNVVLDADSTPQALERDLAAALHAALGLQIAVLARSRDQLAAVVAGDPLAGVWSDPRRYQVSFLGGVPQPGRVAELEVAEVTPEWVAVRGREIYAWHPNGVARSALAALITPRRLGVEVTARSWRTITALLALASDESRP